MADLSMCDVPLSPLDGRYRGDTAPLRNFLSEAALNRARIHVEVEWLIFLSRCGALPGAPEIDDDDAAFLRALPEDFDSSSIAELAELEAVTKHDVKAVEYYIARRLTARSADRPESPLASLVPMVHIFATSEDINNLAYGVTLRGAVHEVWLPEARGLVDDLTAMASRYADLPMLSRTHGQTATPTTVGKELAVFVSRLTRQLDRIAATEFRGKFNGATGTFGAHAVALPNAPWLEISQGFVESLGLTWNKLTTQIESHDWQAELCSDVARFNRIVHNLATDMWTYISLGYFHQNLSAQGSTGSSTMPHKVNPIRFENAEANCELSCALLDALASTLVTSRLQRDLTDSTTQRNFGVAFGHSLLALRNIRRGLAGVDADAQVLNRDLDEAWEVLAEPIQQVMRVLAIQGVPGMENPYERLKDLTRGEKVGPEKLRDFVRSLGLPPEEEARLVALTPHTYIGLASELAQ